MAPRAVSQRSRSQHRSVGPGYRVAPAVAASLHREHGPGGAIRVASVLGHPQRPRLRSRPHCLVVGANRGRVLPTGMSQRHEVAANCQQMREIRGLQRGHRRVEAVHGPGRSARIRRRRSAGGQRGCERGLTLAVHRRRRSMRGRCARHQTPARGSEQERRGETAGGESQKSAPTLTATVYCFGTPFRSRSSPLAAAGSTRSVMYCTPRNTIS